MVFINVVYSALSLVGFAMCWTSSNLDSFINSPVYIVCIFAQIGTEVFFTIKFYFGPIRCIIKRIVAIYNMLLFLTAISL